MREFDKIFSVRPQEPEYFLPTRFAGLATLVTSGVVVGLVASRRLKNIVMFKF